MAKRTPILTDVAQVAEESGNDGVSGATRHTYSSIGDARPHCAGEALLTCPSWSDDRPASVPVVSEAGHGTSARWHSGCHCALCRRAHSDTQRAWGRARSQKRLPVEVRKQLLDALYAGQPFRAVLRDVGLTSNRVFGLTND